MKDAGGRIIVSPDTNVEVIAAAAKAGLVSSPGYFTPSEAFAALRRRSDSLKLFPAEGATPGVLKAQLAVIPEGRADHGRRRGEARQHAAVARRWRGGLRPRLGAVQARPIGR